MKVKELFEIWDTKDHSRSEYDWHREVSSGDSASHFRLVDRNGKLVRGGLTKRAAELLQHRPDLVKKHGKLTVK